MILLDITYHHWNVILEFLYSFMETIPLSMIAVIIIMLVVKHMIEGDLMGHGD